VLSAPLEGPKGAEFIRAHVLKGARKCLSVGARLLWIDSVKAWCPDAVTQDEAASALMDAAKEAAALSHTRGRLKGHNLVVVLVHHLAEKDGRMLGPTSLWSQADFRLCVLPPEGMKATDTTLRRVVPEGRFDGLAPDELRYRMREDGVLVAVSGGAMGGVSVRPSEKAPAAPKVEASEPLVAMGGEGRGVPPAPVPSQPARPQRTTSLRLVPAPPAVVEPAPPKRDLKAEGRTAVLAYLAARPDRTAWVPIGELLAAQPGGLASTALQQRLKELRDAGTVAFEKRGKALSYRLPPMSP
jgi:hypothetical protein